MRSYLTYRLRRLSVPVLAIGLALGARLLLDPILHTRMPYGLFMVAVILTACFADTWETLVALFLGLILGAWFFVEPRSSLMMHGASNWLSGGCYLFIGLAIVWIARNGHAAHVRELSSAVQLRKCQEELELAKARHRQDQGVHEILSGMIENSPDALVAIGADKAIISWNAAAEKLFGYSGKETIGQPVSILFAPGTGLEESPLFRQLMQDRKAEHRAIVRNRRNGLQAEVLVTLSPVTDSAGHLKGACLVASELQVLQT